MQHNMTQLTCGLIDYLKVKSNDTAIDETNEKVFEKSYLGFVFLFLYTVFNMINYLGVCFFFKKYQYLSIILLFSVGLLRVKVYSEKESMF